MRSRLRVAVLMACHNRKKTTIRCLESLYAAKPSNWNLKIYLVDDGSTDGTGDAVEQFDPTIQIIKGDGNWYWAHSMYQAEMAINEPHDVIMWLNDDTKLDVDSLSKIDFQFALNPDSILIGQFQCSTTNDLTYGGYAKYDRHPFHFKQLHAQGELMTADTFNGNLVFISSTASNIVGPIDGEFAHAYADIDYGLRAKRLGVEMFIIPGFAGTCDNHPKRDSKSLADALNLLLSTKHSPLKSQIRFLKRHGSLNWPIYLIAPFIRIFSVSIFSLRPNFSRSSRECS
jgi:GT2 family glycosyltransferase